MILKSVFPRVYDGVEKLKIVYESAKLYSMERSGMFTSSELSEFIIRTRGVYITPSSIAAVLKRLKQVKKIGEEEYVFKDV